jgi:hypothetical protein
MEKVNTKHLKNSSQRSSVLKDESFVRVSAQDYCHDSMGNMDMDGADVVSTGDCILVANRYIL